MAKRRKTRAIARRSSRSIRRSSRGTAKIGVLPALGGLAIVGVLLSNDYGGSGASPVTALMAGNWNLALYSLSKNLTTPTVLAALIPAVIVLWALLALHKKFGARTRISSRRGHSLV